MTIDDGNEVGQEQDHPARKKTPADMSGKPNLKGGKSTSKISKSKCSCSKVTPECEEKSACEEDVSNGNIAVPECVKAAASVCRMCKNSAERATPCGCPSTTASGVNTTDECQSKPAVCPKKPPESHKTPKSLTSKPHSCPCQPTHQDCQPEPEECCQPLCHEDSKLLTLASSCLSCTVQESLPKDAVCKTPCPVPVEEKAEECVCEPDQDQTCQEELECAKKDNFAPTEPDISACLMGPSNPCGLGTPKSMTPQPRVMFPAPFFKATSVFKGQFIDVKLTDYRGKYLCLFFYPLDFTFVCPTEITAMSDLHDVFKETNCAILGCSCDSQFTHLAFTNTPKEKNGLGEISFPLMADYTKTISCKYNVLTDDGVSQRALFIIDPVGIIRYICVNDSGVGRNTDEALRIVRAIKTVDDFDEMCPHGWLPGSTTIAPTRAGALEYYWKKYGNDEEAEGTCVADAFDFTEENMAENMDML